MISLPYLIELNNKTRTLRTNFNRDSSACFSRSGAVIHSGIHRSTAFVSDETALASLRWSKALGQQALNGWIEATIDGACLEDCELTALCRQFPEWTFHTVKTGGKLGSVHYEATRTSGKLVEIVAASNWQTLSQKLQ